MSEFSPSASSLFERLEQSMIDPHVESKMELARLYEDRLNETDYTIPTLTEYVDDLDKGWQYMGARLKVTGTMWYGAPGEGLWQAQKVENLEVISQGFSFNPDKIILDEEYLIGMRHAAFQFLFPDQDTAAKGYVGVMQFDDIEHIEYPFPSHELREQRFPINHSELASHIDEALRGAEDDNEKIRRLQDFTIEVDYANGDDIERMEDSQAYLNSVMELDMELPFYYLQLLGRYGKLDEDRGIMVEEAERQFRRIADIKRVSLQPDDLYESAEAKRRFVPCLDVVLHGRQRGDASVEAIVPFSSIVWAEPVRTAP